MEAPDPFNGRTVSCINSFFPNASWSELQPSFAPEKPNTQYAPAYHCRNEIYPAHRLQGCDELGKGPLGHRVTDRLLQTLDTLALLAHRPQKLFEHNTLLTMLKLLQHEPIHVGRPPRLFARIMSPEPKHERGDLLALAFEVFPRCLTGAREISHRLMPLVGHPDRGEFPGAR